MAEFQISKKEAYTHLTSLYDRLIGYMENGNRHLDLSVKDIESLRMGSIALDKWMKEDCEHEHQCDNCKFAEDMNKNPYWTGFYKCHMNYGYHPPYDRCDFWKGDKRDETE